MWEFRGRFGFFDERFRTPGRGEEFSARCSEPFVKKAEPLIELSKFPLT